MGTAPFSETGLTLRPKASSYAGPGFVFPIVAGVRAANGVAASLERGALGAPCSADLACSSAHCEQGVCCSEACEGACTSCAVTGSFGTCVAMPPGLPPLDPSGCPEEPASSCGRTGLCDGAGACEVLPEGTACVGNGTCQSGACILDACRAHSDCPEGWCAPRSVRACHHRKTSHWPMAAPSGAALSPSHHWLLLLAGAALFRNRRGWLWLSQRERTRGDGAHDRRAGAGGPGRASDSDREALPPRYGSRSMAGGSSGQRTRQRHGQQR
jgi:hypothetical protein